MTIKNALDTQVAHVAFMAANDMFMKSSDEEPITLQVLVDRLTKELILDLLEFTGDNQSKVARCLQVSRTTLLTKIKQFGIEVDRRRLRDDGYIQPL